MMVDPKMCSSSGFADTTIEPVATNVAQPFILPNGNHRCNHQCKDKSACNHVCCKEGVKGKPKKGLQSAATYTAGKQNPRPASECKSSFVKL